MPKKMKTKEQKAEPRRIIENFTSNLESIGVFVNNLKPVAAAYDEEALRKKENIKDDLREIIRDSSIIDDGDGNNPTKNLDIPDEKVEQAIEEIMEVLADHKKLPRVTIDQVELLYKSSFVMLNSYFDYLLYDIVHCYYRLFPESLSEDLSITLSELKVCADRDEAIDVILDKRVSAVIRGGLNKILRYFKEELKIDLKIEVVNWDVINEAIERRNIIVHNNSIINRRYLKNVDLSTVPEKKRTVIEGKYLSVRDEYFNRACNEIFIAGVILTQRCWRKWVKKDIDIADTSLNNSIFEMLLKEEWNAAERLGLFSKDIEVCYAESRYMLDINYCQSLKWQGEKVKLGKELAGFDESILSPRFLAALSALRDDKAGFYENAEKAVAIKEMTEDNFYLWPLFRELRKDTEYSKKIEEMFEKNEKSD